MISIAMPLMLISTKMKRRLETLTILLCLAGSALAASKHPNVLLIVADDLGYSDLGCYGGEIDTPNLDALAADGLRLTRFYNTGRCCPSRAAILTGQYPHRVGLGHMTQDIGRPGYRGKVADDAVTIAQVLAGRNYRSFIAGKWHLGTPDPTKHGFEAFYGTLVSAKTFWDPDHFTRLPAQPALSFKPGTFYATDAVTEYALSFLDRARQTADRPWFLYLAYNAPHFPLQAKPADIKKYADSYHVGWDVIRTRRLARMKELGIVPESTKLSPRSGYWDYGEANTGVNPDWNDVPDDRRTDLARRMAIYAAMIHCLDRNIGFVIDDLRAAGELNDTLVVFISDNGACAEWDPWGFDIKSSPQNKLHQGEEIEAMGGPGTFHSVGSGWANASNTPWRLYKHFNHEGGINSPCIMHWPGKIAHPGGVDHTPTHVIDLLPTIAQAAEADYRGAIALPGTSLIDLMGGQVMQSRDLFFEHEGNRAMISGRWKIVALKDQPWELYDTKVDRTELTNLAQQQAELLQALSKSWKQWAQATYVTPLPRDYEVPYLKPR